METKKAHLALALAALCTLFGGCASITGTTIQSVSVQTREKAGPEVIGASCEMNNNKGKWFVTTPGSATITRSNDDLQVLCNKAGHEPGRASVVSATKGMMFGNIIFGGGIGAIVDHNTGAAYEYPSFFQIVMGEFTKIEPSKAPDGQASPADPSSTSISPQPANLSQPSTKPQTNLDDKLRELKRLHYSGLITQEVYLEQQRKLIEAGR